MSGRSGLQPFQLIINATSNIAFAAIVGSFSALVLLAGNESAWARSRKDAIEGVLRAALAIGIGAAILGLWILAALISELPLLESLGSIDKILLQTHAGHAWAVGTTALVVVLIVRPRKGRQQNGAVLALGGACAVLFAASRSWVSHAGATGDLLAFAVDWAHLVSVSVWAGMVGISATVVFRGPIPSTSGRKASAPVSCRLFRIPRLRRSPSWSSQAPSVLGARSVDP